MSSYAMPLACAALMLTGCQQQQPQSTMDLLRAGNPGVCTASDVEDSLRQLIRPKGDAAAGYTISFADASLEAFDKTVSRASCNAALTIDGPNGAVVERTVIDFAVLPAAQNPDSFIVSGAFGAFADRLQEAIDSDASDKERQEAMQRDHEAFAALVKPGWLIGRWVGEGQGSEACAAGPHDDYGRGGRLMSNEDVGRWQLKDQTLTVILPDISATFTVTAASMDAFTMEDGKGTESNYRRCSADEMQAASAPDPALPAPSEPAPSEPDGQPSPT